jgi:hypothetical protein
MALMLIDAGAQSIPNCVRSPPVDVSYLVQAGKSPLLLACSWPSVSIIRQLINRGDAWDAADKVQLPLLLLRYCSHDAAP